MPAIGLIKSLSKFSVLFRDNMTDQLKKIGILWGGGLGDLLMIRPLLAAVHSEAKIESYLLTTASHVAGLFREFCGPTAVVQLPRKAGSLPPVIKKWRRFFDLLYLGPYPNLKTRMLARLLQPEKIWSRLHRQASPFMLEQVLCDCAELGLQHQSQKTDFRSFLPWPVAPAAQPFADERPFLVLHAASKQRWETKCWPAEKWSRLTEQLLAATRLGVCFTGIGAEEGLIRSITAGLPAGSQERIGIFLNQSLQDTAALIDAGSGVICHNSGILQLSAMLGKKTLCLTGSSAPYWQPPYAWVKNITSGACGLACNRYTCPVPFYRAKCIRALSVEDVWVGLRRHGLLNE